MTISKELLDERLKGYERTEDLLGNDGLMKDCYSPHNSSIHAFHSSSVRGLPVPISATFLCIVLMRSSNEEACSPEPAPPVGVSFFGLVKSDPL